MANNAYQKGERIEITSFAVAHKAGDFVYEKGYFGVVEEDVKAGGRGYMILGEIWKLKRVPASAAMGTKLYALPTSDATTLPMISSATGNYVPVGRLAATSNASGIAPVLVFGPSAY